jgi:hypothetical protein
MLKQRCFITIAQLQQGVQMRIILQIFLIGFLAIVASQASDTKLYEIKNGQIKYKIQGTINMMGVKTKTTGTKSLTFDQFGAQMLTDEEKTETSQNETKKIHNITYLKSGVVYLVDFDSKRIIRSENMLAMMSGDMAQKGKEMMQQMGGKQVGVDKVLGYECELWELMGITQCIYKGIPLKIESNIMGNIHTETAIEANFKAPVNQQAFKLPDFPITDQMGNMIDKQQINKMDTQSSQEMQELEKAAKNFMGSDMFTQMKQELLAQESLMLFLKKCLEKADTKDDAQKCASHASTVGADDEEDFLDDEWNAQIKSEALQEINYYLQKIAPCVKQSQDIQTLQSCMQ